MEIKCVYGTMECVRRVEWRRTGVRFGFWDVPLWLLSRAAAAAAVVAVAEAAAAAETAAEQSRERLKRPLCAVCFNSYLLFYDHCVAELFMFRSFVRCVCYLFFGEQGIQCDTCKSNKQNTGRRAKTE